MTTFPTQKLLRALAFSLLCCLFHTGLFAQAPSGFRFQAVARDASNNAMTSENIAVRVSLLRGGPAGTTSYSERHEVTTTDLGVFDLHIGNGVALSGNINTIDWGSDNYFLKIDIDPAGGTNYVNLGSSQLLSVPYALYAKASGGENPTDELQNLTYNPTTQTLGITNGNSVTLQLGSGGTDDQQISLSGTVLSIENGNSVDLSVLRDGVNDADADPNNEIQNLSIAGNQLSLSRGGGSVTLPQTTYSAGSGINISGGNVISAADNSATNEIQSLSLSGTNLSLSNGGGTVNLSGLGGGGLTLPYYEDVTANGAAFHVQNDAPSSRFGLAGSVGANAETLPVNNAGVLGQGVGAHGVFGNSKTSFFAGVQGVSESTTGYGVLGYGFGGGIGGYFYTTNSGVAALTTGVGNVGIGTQTPEMKMHVAGDLFVQTNLGGLKLGFPSNGNQWQMTTSGSGSTLEFFHKPSGATTQIGRFSIRQDGEATFGNSSAINAWVHVLNNSTTSKPHLKLEEVGNDYARLELTNNASGGSFWHLAGLPSATASSAKLNFYFSNSSGAADRMILTGDGQLGVNGDPAARLHIFQRGQSVGTGLRFTDGTANSPWDITHGFSLRFHYGNDLRGFINATTGAYTQSSDKSLKENIQNVGSVLAKVRQLEIKNYSYKSDSTHETTIGLLAQDAQPLFPELVSYSKADGLYGVNYAGFSMVAIRAVQEQQAEIDQLKAENAQLKAQSAALAARLERIEQLLLAKE
ncbi:tail fiber domain-containing protein [Neolewinella lacunae]|uniref:Tail fiber domain-containing protein n=1 Tax=Neolewinella lacunae TaxID=1517758 RepID=A0A923PJ42_9BACT|nr:tail fiber domain-containing protein [Neolewinella lacunae]MBC6995025.1 tail fiber domain-containing protein [Neolewinella lacunae]MDN3633204.1 tail fiber domain-containing protein [Neolewinella lacunae]